MSTKRGRELSLLDTATCVVDGTRTVVRIGQMRLGYGPCGPEVRMWGVRTLPTDAPDMVVGLDEDVEIDTWKPVAENFKSLCLQAEVPVQSFLISDLRLF